MTWWFVFVGLFYEALDSSLCVEIIQAKHSLYDFEAVQIWNLLDIVSIFGDLGMPNYSVNR